MRHLGLDPGETMMVGDSRRSDYDGPRGVGIEATLLQRQGKDRQIRAIESLSELPGVVLV